MQIERADIALTASDMDLIALVHARWGTHSKSIDWLCIECFRAGVTAERDRAAAVVAIVDKSE